MLCKKGICGIYKERNRINSAVDEQKRKRRAAQWQEEKAYVSNSVLMNGAKIESGAKVINAIIGPDTLIEKDEIVEGKDDDIELVVNQKGARK